MTLKWEGQWTVPKKLFRQTPCPPTAKWHLPAIGNDAYTSCGRQLRRDLESKSVRALQISEVCSVCLRERKLVAA